MTTLHKAAQAALEALERLDAEWCRFNEAEFGLQGMPNNAFYSFDQTLKAINDLRAALAQEPAQPAAQDPMRSVFIHLFNAAVEEPAATPRLVNATRTARGHLFGDGKPMREEQPARQDWVGVPCLERMRVTMTRLGLATDESLEGFGASLEDNIYSMCRTVNRILDTLQEPTQPAGQEPEIAMIDAAMVEMKNIYPPLKRTECQRLIRAALAARPAVQEPDQNTRIVKVTSQGVSFGDAWFSHERITGKSAASLNEGGSGVAARQYMKWLSTPQEPAQQPATPFEDPRVQIVYDVLCDTDDRPPKDSELHWEGWVAQRVVDKLFAKPTNQQAGFTWIDLHRELQGAQWLADLPGWSQALDMVCKRLLELDAMQQSNARKA